MFEMWGTQLIRRVAMDIAVWCCIPSVFLFFYIHDHSVSNESVAAHLYLVLVGLLGLALLRIAIYRLIPNQVLAYIVISCVIAALLLLMLLYYALVLIGLRSWARVISWELITSYSVQLPGLTEALGLSVHLVGMLLALAYFVLICTTYAYLKRFDWIVLLSSKISGFSRRLILTVGSAICAIALYHFVSTPPIQKSEPLSLTFFPTAAARSFQRHSIDNFMAEKLDRLEDAARLSYVANNNERNKSNLVLIVVDALRPDHMSVYGYQRNTTPNIAHLIQSHGGYVISNVRASCGDSSCGLLSLASSKFVHQFSNRPFTLQQALRRQGYRVSMILGGDHTNFYGLKDIYGEVDSYFDGSMAGRGHYVNDDEIVLDHTKHLPAWDGRPIMMQFHLMSTHVLGKRHDRFAKYSPFMNYALFERRANKNRESFVNFYDNGVAQADIVIHELLTILEDKGYLKNALVVITADHGESLGEHDLYAHANSVREEALLIPLIFIPFGYQSKFKPRTESAISQVDIAPTILADFGFSVPETWSGVSIQSALPSNYTYFQEGQAAGVIDRRDPQKLWKYWFDARTGNEYAFDLTHDSKEKYNLISEVPSHLKRDWRLRQMQLMRGLQIGSDATYEIFVHE